MNNGGTMAMDGRIDHASYLDHALGPIRLPLIPHFSAKNWFKKRRDSCVHIGQVFSSFESAYCDGDGLLEEGVPELYVVSRDLVVANRADRVMSEFQVFPTIPVAQVAMLIETQGLGQPAGGLWVNGCHNLFPVKSQEGFDGVIEIFWRARHGWFIEFALMANARMWQRTNRLFLPVPRPTALADVR